jgi:hypothetical protein
MGSPTLPEMTALANIRDALNLYYYGQLTPTSTPPAGLAKEFGDRDALITTLQVNTDARKPPAFFVQSSALTAPAPSSTDNNNTGLWVDTAPGVLGTAMGLAKYWDGAAWQVLAGKAREDLTYSWTQPHLFKSTINYFANDAAKLAAITAPVEGQLAVVDNRVQVYDGAWRNVSLPPAGTTKQALLKTDGTDFNTGWADVVTPTGNHTLSGTNTFTGTTAFNVAPTMVGVTVSGTATVTTLNVSGTTGLAVLNVSGALTQSGQANLNGKTIVKNDTTRDSGFFIGTKRIYILPTAPTTGVAGDIWIQG